MVSAISMEEHMADNYDFSKQAEDMMADAQKMAQPEHVQKLMKDGIEKTREAQDKVTSAIGDASKEFETVYATAQTATQKLSEKAVENFKTNSDAVYEYANALANCGSPTDAFEVQSNFLKQQFELLNRQTKEFFELSNEVTTNVVQSAAEAAKKTTTT